MWVQNYTNLAASKPNKTMKPLTAFAAAFLAMAAADQDQIITALVGTPTGATFPG